MANSFGTLSTSLVVQRALDLAFVMFPVLNRVSLDLSDQAVDFNQSVITRKLAEPSVSAFGSAAADITTTDVSVQISNHSQIRHTIAVASYSGTKRNLIDEQAQPLAVAIGRYMITQIAALWTNTNFGGGSTQETLATTTPTFASAQGVATWRTVLNGRGVPQFNRFAVVNSTLFQSLLTDPAIAYNYANPNDGKVIQGGVLTKVAGIDIYEMPGLATGGATSAGTRGGVVGTPDSTVYAARIQKDPRLILDNAQFPGNYGVVTGENGMSVLLTEWIDPATMDANIRLSWMWGAAVGNSSNLQILRAT